nr:hypothetical protein [Lachnospiraceae bacterium]
KPDPLCIYLLFIVTFLFITGRNSRSLDDETKKPGLIPLTSLLLLAFMLILFYFQYSGRWTHRVVYGAMLSLSVVLTYLAVSQKRCREAGNDMQGITVFCIVLLTAAGAGVLFGNRLEYNSYKRTEPPYRDFCAYLSDNEDKLFIADTFTFQMAYRYDVFRPYKNGALDNFVTVGSWFANSPVTKDITRRYGYDNPYEALASGDDKVILADNMYPEEKTEFLNEHYENSYRLGDHEEISGITLYRMVKE